MGSPGRVQPSNRSPCCAPLASRAPTLIPKPGPARHLPTPARTYRPLTLPHSSAQPDPWGRPSPGTLLLPSADRFRSDLFPPGSPLPCLPGAPPFPGVFLSPFPSRPPASDNSPPPGFAGLLTPRPSPGPLPGRPGPALPLAPTFPVWIWVAGYLGAPLLSSPALHPSRILPAPVGTPSREAGFHLSWAQGPLQLVQGLSTPRPGPCLPSSPAP